MPLQVTALYAGLLCALGLVLAGMVGRIRGNANISLGNGGNRELIEADRRHMNWVEYVPFILLLLAIFELNGGSRTWLHVMGATLLIARVCHPLGISTTRMMMWQRMVGAGGTMLVAAAAIVSVLWQYVSG